MKGAEGSLGCGLGGDGGEGVWGECLRELAQRWERRGKI